MRLTSILSLIFLAIFPPFATQAWPADMLDSDSGYSIKIAVTINEDDSIIGKLEYTNLATQYSLQLVTFDKIGDVIHAEPYLFEILERTIVSKNVHRIKCRSVNDKYGAGSIIVGMINFRDELRPKVHLMNESGFTYISNITEKGEETHKQYIPNIWLGH